MHTKEEKLLAFARLLDVQERLRKECPWDKKQTYESLRPNTIEETFELADALIKNDTQNICKELGDVMEHVVFYSMLGQETDDFDVADVCNAQSDKLMFRHDFIDWTGWKIDNPNMVIAPNGQVVYKDELAAKN
ncbi:MAG: nucleoside triphosphate pyrophosphohydrolase, partial [Prevotella bivia]|nr:nucleoside triphosphate pyrophosphohydrolase [Prevotella bivia]